MEMTTACTYFFSVKLLLENLPKDKRFEDDVTDREIVLQLQGHRFDPLK